MVFGLRQLSRFVNHNLEHMRKIDNQKQFDNEKSRSGVERDDGDSGDSAGSDLTVMLARAFLLLVGSSMLFGVALVWFPPATYLDLLGFGLILIAPYFIWGSLFADRQFVKQCSIEILDRLF